LPGEVLFRVVIHNVETEDVLGCPQCC